MLSGLNQPLPCRLTARTAYGLPGCCEHGVGACGPGGGAVRVALKRQADPAVAIALPARVTAASSPKLTSKLVRIFYSC